MSANIYDSFNLGTPVQEVVAKAGKPYAIYQKGPRSVEYVYVQRLDFGMADTRETHYILTFSDGQLVSKRTTAEKSPPFNLIYQEDPNYTNY